MVELANVDLLVMREEILARREARFFSRAARREGALHLVPDHALVGAYQARLESLYEEDDRRMEAVMPGGPYEKPAECVMAVFRRSRVRMDGAQCVLTTPAYGTAWQMCRQERFWDQPIGAEGTAFLVARDIVATAAHVIRANACENIYFVLGYMPGRAVAPETTLDTECLYKGSLIAKKETLNGQDWALVRLDRKVDEGRFIPQIRREGKVATGTKLYTIGHPCGLPLTVADHAEVRGNGHSEVFLADLDTYKYCSGSPVFGEDGVVEGVLVRGNADFDFVGGCYRSAPARPGIEGKEACTRTTVFAELLGKLTGA